MEDPHVGEINPCWVDDYRELLKRLPGLVNVYITNWKHPPFLMGKSTISMAIFNSHVSLPEGISWKIPI